MDTICKDYLSCPEDRTCEGPQLPFSKHKMSKARYYVQHTIVPFEEDATHEFKGHRNLAVEELPPWCFFPGTDRRSRRAVSRFVFNTRSS